MTVNIKSRVRIEWIIILFEILLITTTFFYTLELFRLCDCCPVTKIIIHSFLILGILMSGLYMIHLANEVDAEKTITILHRFQHLKLFIFLLIVTSWIMTIIVSNNILKRCGVEEKSDVHINNFNGMHSDTQQHCNHLKDTIFIINNYNPIPKTIVKNYINNVNNKKDTITIVNKMNDSSMHFYYMSKFNAFDKKIDSLENKEFINVYNIHADKLKIKGNKYLRKVSIQDLLGIDSLNINSDKIKIKGNKFLEIDNLTEEKNIKILKFRKTNIHFNRIKSE